MPPKRKRGDSDSGSEFQLDSDAGGSSASSQRSGRFARKQAKHEDDQATRARGGRASQRGGRGGKGSDDEPEADDDDFYSSASEVVVETPVKAKTSQKRSTKGTGKKGGGKRVKKEELDEGAMVVTSTAADGDAAGEDAEVDDEEDNDFYSSESSRPAKKSPKKKSSKKSNKKSKHSKRSKKSPKKRTPGKKRAAKRAARGRRARNAAGDVDMPDFNEEGEDDGYMPFEEQLLEPGIDAEVVDHHPELRTVWREINDINKDAAPPVEQPGPLSLKLLPYQLEGLAWMTRQEQNPRFRGGILADEMGMGKTIQTVSLMVSQRLKKPTLVICPTVALVQWHLEIQKYTAPGVLTVGLFYGPRRFDEYEDIEKNDVILTTYSVVEGCFRRANYGTKKKGELVKVPSVLHATNWGRIVLDEAHNIKDRSCSTARAVFGLKSDYKWSLSGTPLQNRIGELYSLIRFLDVEPFSFYFCKKCPCTSLTWQFSGDSYKKACACGHRAMSHFCWWNLEILKPIQKYGNFGDGKVAFEKLRRLLRVIMLRRTKLERAADLGLPPKTVVVRRDNFNEEERDFYRALFTNVQTQFAAYVHANTVLNNYAHIFSLLSQMRQAADHPYLVTHNKQLAGDTLSHVCGLCQERAEDAIAAGCKHIFCRACITQFIDSAPDEDSITCPTCFRALTCDLNQAAIVPTALPQGKRKSVMQRLDLGNWRSSTKVEALLEELTVLREKEPGAKSLVFSQFTNFLDIIEWRLQKAGFRCVKMDGTMSPQQRGFIIDAFTNVAEITVFLISLKAGGVALNLTEASNVFLMDPWWNPAVESQAMDRIHRLGQYRPVRVTRIIVEDSIESRIVQLQVKKQLMFESTVGGDPASLNRLSEADLRFLFIL